MDFCFLIVPHVDNRDNNLNFSTTAQLERRITAIQLRLKKLIDIEFADSQVGYVAHQEILIVQPPPVVIDPT
jgi:hypothetical protein